MPDIPADTPSSEKGNPGAIPHRWLELAVPLFSFGGALLAVVVLISEIPLDSRITILGCVFASWVLAYLAWIRPRKDIVALSTPLYSFIFLAVPTDTFSSIVLQLLYAISLTILLLRLKFRFGEPGTAATLGKELGGSLLAYTKHTRDSFGSVSPETAHAATLAFVRFAEGNYEQSAQSAKNALVDTGTADPGTVLMRAFGIVREHAVLLHTSKPRPLNYLVFTGTDLPLLARSPLKAKDDERAFYLALDNALLVLFSAAWNNSERDHPYLLACQAFAQKLMDE
jgi:hypothetical protein